MNRLPPLLGVALCVVIWGIPSTEAQTIETSSTPAQVASDVFGFAGASIVHGETLLRFTLGQAVVGRGALGGTYAHQGFWHPQVGSKSASTIDPSTDSLLLTGLPNPFAGIVALQFTVPNAGHVSLELYDALGHRVIMLMNEERDAGPVTATCDLTDLPSGSYTAVLHIGEALATTELILID